LVCEVLTAVSEIRATTQNHFSYREESTNTATSFNNLVQRSKKLVTQRLLT